MGDATGTRCAIARAASNDRNSDETGQPAGTPERCCAQNVVRVTARAAPSQSNGLASFDPARRGRTNNSRPNTVREKSPVGKGEGDRSPRRTPDAVAAADAF
jgi:hypothetical protein